MDKDDIKKIKDIVEDLLKKMTIEDFSLDLKSVSLDVKDTQISSNSFLQREALSHDLKLQDTIHLNIELKEPQILIGSGGQNLFDLQRILRIVLNKKLGVNFYLEIDINNYKNKKIEHLKNLAKNVADEVSLTREAKTLFPMPAYQRRVIHMELSKRQDVIVESQGDREGRHIIIKPVA